MANYPPHSLLKKNVYKKARIKWPKSLRKSKKITRLNLQKLSVFVGLKLILRHYYIQIAKERIHIRVYKIKKGSVTQFIQFISAKLKKILRQS